MFRKAILCPQIKLKKAFEKFKENILILTKKQNKFMKYFIF